MIHELRHTYFWRRAYLPNVVLLMDVTECFILWAWKGPSTSRGGLTCAWVGSLAHQECPQSNDRAWGVGGDWSGVTPPKPYSHIRKDLAVNHSSYIVSYVEGRPFFNFILLCWTVEPFYCCSIEAPHLEDTSIRRFAVWCQYVWLQRRSIKLTVRPQ